ncbi:restriction endonuclease subunit S [Staphylococcus caprae]|uniref:restriction endonuclease subunit S n=1 Tax=Staphylococcus TaxID=1279 RepID=UPI000A275759|nr:restriction endonuclease subunit S [Staphylococcus caprae]ARM67822.1 hypothetical protein [Staphylococcus phage IME1323_01]PAK65176.1 hypothetical protein B9K00_04240 [Staphylococcus caprae]BBD90362.1 hypothetical protein JMUB145_1794 [Staphylococcus caprae]
MMKLSDREWKTFVLEDLFKVSGTKTTPLNLLKKNNKKNNKQFPYVTTKSTYNGIDNFFSEYTEDGNVITIDSATDGYVFFQLNKFSASDHVEKLTPKFEINKFIGLFILISIKKATKNKYGYGYKFSQTRIKRQKILLPVNNNNPDYKFMEQYIKEKYFNLKSQIKEKQKHEITDYRELNQVEWKVFEMDNIFRFVQGKSKGLNHLKKGGNVPYLAAKYNNNGVLTFVETENNLMSKGNCISFIRNGEGSMGLSIYKSENHIATSDITNGYNDFLNRYTGKFISTISNLVRGKYNFGYKRSLTRLKKEKIKLPTKNNQPDYDFMEQYMKRKENEVLERI